MASVVNTQERDNHFYFFPLGSSRLNKHAEVVKGKLLISNILPDETASLQGQPSVNWSGLANPLRPPPEEQGYCFAFLLIFSQPLSGLLHTVVLQG